MSQRGFSLPELMVSSAIGVIVALSISTVFIFSVSQFQIMIEKSQSEENALLLAFYTRIFISQATDLRLANDVTPSTSVDCNNGNFPGAVPASCAAHSGLSGSEGFIDYNYDYQLESLTKDSGAVTALAAFNREWGIEDTTQLPTAVFVRDSNTGSGDTSLDDTEKRSATVFFSLSSSANTLSTTSANIKFDRVHRYEVQKVPLAPATAVDVSDPDSYCLAIEVEPRPQFSNAAKQAAMDSYPAHCLPPEGQQFGGSAVPAGGILSEPSLNTTTTPKYGYKVKTVSMHMATRHYKTINRNVWDYRTLASATGATFQAPFKDVDMTVKISIKNNVLGTSVTSGTTREERVHGGLYFFRPLFPKF